MPENFINFTLENRHIAFGSIMVTKEAINSINKFCGVKKSKLVKDSIVVQTMRYMELLQELKKSGNKNKKVI